MLKKNINDNIYERKFFFVFLHSKGDNAGVFIVKKIYFLR